MDTLATQITQHVPRMYRVALRIVGSPEAAQEVAQEACVRALRGAEKFGGRAGLATWLHRITVNCAHDHLRKNRRADRGRTEWDSPAMDALAMLDAAPDEHAQRSETYRLALELIAELPEDCRGSFVLTQLDGYTYDEAAAIEGLSRGTIASRVYRTGKS